MAFMVDFAIVGGGIIGSAVARELARRKAGSVLVVEKEPALGRHASGRNSGVIHSGINQKPGSLKARMCVEGARRAREFCRRRGVPMRECGTMVLAREEGERIGAQAAEAFRMIVIDEDEPAEGAPEGAG